MARKPTRRECFEKAAPHLARLMLADTSTQSSDASSTDQISGGPAAPASPSDPEAA